MHFKSLSSFCALPLVALAILIVPGTTRVMVAVTSNRTYTVQFTDNLNSGAWTKLADIMGRLINRVESFTDLAWTSNRWYRVVTPRQP
jgi:hypothetical protein